MIRTPVMTVMIDAATKASRSLKRDFGEIENLQVSMKGPGDFVSAADKKAEKIIFESLSKARPGYGFVMEESGVVEGSDQSHRWHIDPLDGTTNFLHAIPHAAISIALERDGALVAGVVYDFIKEELFIGEKGQGAYLNNRRIRVSARRSSAEALIGTGIPHIGKGGHAESQREIAQAMLTFQNVRRMGAAALDLAYVACGRFDGFWERKLNSWDIAAGALIVREAGGFISNMKGGEFTVDTTDVCAGNEAIHLALLAALKKAA
ncbi:inositol monophosphatase family protein [Terrarubrum flagellatum]|uniref:inositol monophosphatase family protein n=1 Tax=Terrirubrum flagellatum TaxID=2895980 RepID=UPI0031450B9C